MKDNTTINQTLQTSLKAAPGGEFPGSVALVVSGHMHQFQTVGFLGWRPAQFIVGDSGVKLSKGFPKPKDSPASITIDGMQAQVSGLAKFGYMRFDLGKNGTWTGKLRDPKGKTIADCASDWARGKRPLSVCSAK